MPPMKIGTTRGTELEATAPPLTDARRVSEAERARLESILVGMAEAVLVVDKEENAVLANDSFVRSFGQDIRDLDTMEVDGRPVPAGERPTARAARGESFSLEFTAARDGTRVYYEVVGRPVRVGKEFVGGVLVIRDITDRSLRRLQDEFLAVASHELRTPLTVLKGYLALLDRGIEDREKVREFIRLAGQQATRMERLTNDLVDVVRLRSGHLSLYEVALDINEVVEGSVKTVRALYADRRFACKLATRPLQVTGDPDRLDQVFLNLLLNAAKFTPADGLISVQVRRQRAKAVVTIQDSGPGILPEDLPHLFTPFFRSHGASQSRASGLGLGLYITRELVLAHGGSIHVESELGEGAKLTVRLPVVQATSSAG